MAAIEDGGHDYDAGNPLLVNALWSLALVCYLGGRPELWGPFYAIQARLAPEPPPLLALTIDMIADPVRTGVAARPQLEALLRTVNQQTDPSVVENIAASAIYADRLAEVREPLWRTVLSGRQGGSARRYVVALMELCIDDFHRGQWREASELAAEGLRVSEEHGSRFFGWYLRYHQALLAAVQGRFETSRALADQVIGWAGPRGVGTARVYAYHALVLADLGQGDFEGAYRHATAISPPGRLASHVPHCLWVAMDLVEAAVRTGREAEAQRHVQAMEGAGTASLSPRLGILSARRGGSGLQTRTSGGRVRESAPHAHRRPVAVRCRPDPACLWRTSAPSPCHPRGQVPPSGRPHVIPEASCCSLGLPGRDGTARYRPGACPIKHLRDGLSDTAGAANRPAGRIRHD